MTPVDHQKLIKVASLLSSDNGGERANAAALATAILKRNGLSWEDVLARIAIVVPALPETIPEEFYVEGELSHLRNELAASEGVREELIDELVKAKSGVPSVKVF